MTIYAVEPIVIRIDDETRAVAPGEAFECDNATAQSLIDAGYASEDPVTPGGGGGTVDQTYNATSTNAQSGKAVAEAIAAIPSGGGSLAAMFDYDAPVLIDMDGAHDIAKFMSAYLNLPGMATGIGTSKLGYKVPTVTTGAYTWVDGVDGQTATADVTITFADGSTLVKTLDFKTVKNRWVNAAKGVDGGYIDTGLTLDYGYTLFYEGCQPAGASGAPIGAFTSTAVRTTARLMGNANKMQCMWPGNNEFTNVASGIDFNQMHTAAFNANGVELTQGSTTYTGAFSGTASGTDSAPVLIFNEAAESSQRNSVVRKAGVRSGADTLREIVMAEINGEIVGVDIANLTQTEQDEIISEAYHSVNANRIYRPVGTLEEVTA